MKLILRNITAQSLAVSALLLAFSALQVEAQPLLDPKNLQKLAKEILKVNLSGTWSCDDGGTYYLKQSAGQLFWFGESADGGKSWSNIFHADLNKTGGDVKVGSTIGGAWTDVPKGAATNGGILFLKIESSDRIVITKEGLGRSNFSGTTFTRAK